MYNHKILFSAFCVSTFLSTNIQAQETTKLDEVFVLAPAPIATTPAINSYKMNGLTPSSPYSDGGDYLQSVPGISASRFGGHGLEPFMRGQSQNQLSIIADDVYVFGGCPNRMDTPSSYLSINSYDEITVTKGYQSVLNGPGATGGSIVLKRLAPEPLAAQKIATGTVAGGYDANSDTLNTQANITSAYKDAYIRAHASFKDADNYKDGSGYDVRSSFNERMGGLMIGMTPKNDHIKLSYDINRIEDALFPGAGMDSPLSEAETFKFGFERDYDEGFVQNVDISAYSSLVDHVMDNYSLRTPGAMLRRVDSQSDTHGGKIKTDIAFDEQVITTSLSYRYNKRDADRLQGASANNVNTLQSVMWPGIVSNEIGLAAETTYKTSATGRVIIGGRYDYVNVDFNRADQVSAATGLSANDAYTQFYGYGSREKTEHNLGGLIRYEQYVNEHTSVFTGVSRAVRTADATERGLANWMVMMGNNMSWIGNPEIRPEKHHQFDIGFRKNLEKSTFTASAYINHINDYILRDSARGQSGILMNSTDADVYRNVDALLMGFELEGNWNLSPRFNLTGNIAYTYGENLDENMPLAQITPLQGSVNLAWQAHEYIEVNNQLNWALTQTRVDTDTSVGTGRDIGKTSGYATFDINAKVTNLDPIEFTFGVSNLFDQNYASHLNRSNISDPTEIRVNEPGRTFFLQAKYTF
ncbi:MAG: iron complex outermembrane receptor protein [Alphaproteobacteria bacterium]|jgi:iron complex outermembrane receptor protein